MYLNRCIYLIYVQTAFHKMCTGFSYQSIFFCLSSSFYVSFCSNIILKIKTPPPLGAMTYFVLIPIYLYFCVCQQFKVYAFIVMCYSLTFIVLLTCQIYSRIFFAFTTIPIYSFTQHVSNLSNSYCLIKKIILII